MACTGGNQKENTSVLSDSTRIVSLNGALSEIIAGIGLEKNIVGTDVTSAYPESLKSKPKVGHNRNINAEGVLALKPNLVVALQKDLPAAVQEQFKSAGVRLLLLDQKYSVAGAKNLIQSVSDSLGRKAQGDSLLRILGTQLEQAKIAVQNVKKLKVLFIYARGVGTMMVSGTGTQVGKMIELAGGQNAITGFADYKPLTAEALVEANPDVILLFDDGLESLGGTKGLAGVQGIKQTNAGKNNKVITMKGDLLTSFGPRLGIAVKELAEKLK
ncbi:hemin ABC transporter substrate-binding protein [Pedobacter sp. HMWF019]|nr:hemin ABC transporter substrate-binding protein [Pedobacter sp. HMWF019]